MKSPLLLSRLENKKAAGGSGGFEIFLEGLFYAVLVAKTLNRRILGVIIPDFVSFVIKRFVGTKPENATPVTGVIEPLSDINA